MPNRVIPDSSGLKNNTMRGDVVENYITNNIPCRRCNAIDWKNLNKVSKNVAAVDHCCNNCGLYVQSKGLEWKPNNPNCPLTKLSEGNCWDVMRMPCSKNIRETLHDERYKNNLSYYYVIYKKINGLLIVHSVATSAVVTIRDIDRGEKAIISRKTLWHW